MRRMVAPPEAHDTRGRPVRAAQALHRALLAAHAAPAQGL